MMLYINSEDADLKHGQAVWLDGISHAVKMLEQRMSVQWLSN